MGDFETRMGIFAVQRRSKNLHWTYGQYSPRTLRRGLLIRSTEQFALTEASYTTIRLMQAFESVESRDARPWLEGLTLTCAIHQGTIVALRPA